MNQGLPVRTLHRLYAEGKKKMLHSRGIIHLSRSCAVALLLSLLLPLPVSSKISEERFRNYSASFVAKLNRDNPGCERRIAELMGGMIVSGDAGMRLSDRMGMFLYDTKRHDISLAAVRFFNRDELYALFLIMQDDADNQAYNLYLEYELDRRANRCRLREIYFSMVFEERMRDIKGFFDSR